MDPIVYKPFRFYALTGWMFIGFAVLITLWSWFFVVAAPFLVIPALLLFRKNKVTVMLYDQGIRLLGEQTSGDRWIPWEDLPCCRLDHDLHGHDMLLLSLVPMPPKIARRFKVYSWFSTRLWYDGVLILPLYSVGNADAIRKFVRQKCIQK